MVGSIVELEIMRFKLYLHYKSINVFSLLIKNNHHVIYVIKLKFYCYLLKHIYNKNVKVIIIKLKIYFITYLFHFTPIF